MIDSHSYNLMGSSVNAYHTAGSNIFQNVADSNVANDPSNLIVDGEDFFPGSSGRETNSFGFEAAWRISEKISFSGFFSYTDVNYNDIDADDELWTYGAGFAFPDFGKEGNLLGIFAGVQPYSGELLKLDNTSVPIHVEAFYKYQVNDNISITPGVIWVASPEQFDEVDDAFIGTIRTTFTF